MRITKLTLANFRSFEAEQTIEFAPLTLLFGPNSVGKSTILMALFYIQQILAKGQCDPQRLDAMGERFIGGFQHLVHGKRLDESLRIKIEYDLGERLSSSYTEVGELVMEEVGPVTELIGLGNRATTMSVELEVSWSSPRNTAYVSSYVVGFNGSDLAEVTSDSGLKQPMITSVNYQHELLNYGELAEWSWVTDQMIEGKAIHPSLVWHVNPENQEEERVLTEEDISEYALQGYLHELMQIQPMTGPQRADVSNDSPEEVDHAAVKTVGIDGFAGALPKLGKTLKTNLSADDERLTKVLEEMMSDVLVAPLDNLLKLLNESLCIGPLRHISDPTYKPNSFPEQKDWYSGKACWDVLAKGDLLRDTAINEWLTGEDKLNLGYKLVYKTEEGKARYISPSKQFSSVDDVLAMSDVFGDKFSITLSRENLDDNPQAEQKEIPAEVLNLLKEKSDSVSSLYLGEHPFKESTPALWDCKNDIEVAAADIGVGVSQLLPLLVAATIVENGLVACEQPELHIHPRVQVAVGDLLLQRRNERNFLIETHSEHLILRLLRRVRETSENRLPNGMDPISPEDISIVYLDPSESGVSVRHIDIDEDGEFTSRWPQGFFAERREELL